MTKGYNLSDFLVLGRLAIILGAQKIVHVGSMGWGREVLKNIFFVTNKTIKSACRKFDVWKILSARERWYRSRRGNLYNPIFEATVYPWNDKCNIARFGVHHEGFYSEKYAKKVAFKMWYRKKRVSLKF